MSPLREELGHRARDTARSSRDVGERLRDAALPKCLVCSRPETSPAHSVSQFLMYEIFLKLVKLGCDGLCP